MIHGEAEAQKAADAALALFAGGAASQDVPTWEVNAAMLAEDNRLTTLLASCGLCTSRRDARKMVQQGAGAGGRPEGDGCGLPHRRVADRPGRPDAAQGQEKLLPSDSQMSLNGYKTVLREARDEVVIHKSRFIGHAAPVSSAEEALGFLARIREEHRDATHNCYAYIIGRNAGIMRYSDDGEPSGTAGMPIIEVMKARGVVDCAVVVTRYFGGILLGARAGWCARIRTPVRWRWTPRACARCIPPSAGCSRWPYPLWDRVQHALKSLPARLVGTDFAAAVSFELDMKAADTKRVLAELTRVTDGRVELLKEEERFAPWEEDTP